MKSILVNLQDELYACPIVGLNEIINLSSVTPVPGFPSAISGVSQIRGRTLPVVSLRKLMGKNSWHQENLALLETLKLREQDHINWITHLKNSIQSGQPFTLTLDPTQCAFGKWYYQFKTWNRILTQKLKDFEKPHAAIHRLGSQAIELSKNGKTEQALVLIQEHEQTTLSELINLFSSTRTFLSSNAPWEIGLILTHKHNDFILAVDNVGETMDTTSNLSPISHPYIKSLIQTDTQVIKVLNIEALSDTLFSDNLEL